MGLAYALSILKRGKVELKQPCGVYTSRAINSSDSEKKTVNTVKHSKNLWETDQATMGLATEWAKDLKRKKLGRKLPE